MSDHVKTSKFEKREYGEDYSPRKRLLCPGNTTRIAYIYLKKKTWLDAISKIFLKENEDEDKEELNRKKFLVERINDTKNQKMNKRILSN